jgi:hypothetical protein
MQGTPNPAYFKIMDAFGCKSNNLPPQAVSREVIGLIHEF